MIPIGSRSILEVSAKVPAGLLLKGDDETEILLPNKYIPHDAVIGTKLSVFVYTDSEDRPVATTQVPLAMVGDFACLKVVDRSAHGAFLDWGLDKDLFVPRSEQHQEMIVGRLYVVAVYLDNATNRVAAASRLSEFFDYDLSPLSVGAEVNVVVYGFSDRGTQVLVADKYNGLIYQSETFRRLDIGDRLKGFIAAIRPDNKLDIRLQRTGVSGQKDAQSIVLQALRDSGGAIAVGDKSSPQLIYERFGLSKKAFKAALGGLYKSGRVVLEPTMIKLVDLDQDSTV